MTVQVGHLYRKRTVRGLNGGIIDMVDETKGGAIISKGRVVNQEVVDELAKKELDRQTAAAAPAAAIEVPEAIAEERAAAPSRLEQLEKRMNEQDETLKAILKAVTNK